MERKIIGIFVITLMIITAFSAVAINVREPKSDVSAAIDDKPAINSEKLEIIINSSENNVNNNLEVSINPYTLNELTFPNDVYEIYEGLHWKLHVTVYWDPPQGEQICLWVDPDTLPEGATFPECICAIDSVTGTLDWTPAIGQAGTYEIVFYAGHSCYEPVGTFTVTVIVHPYEPEPYETYEIYPGEEWHLHLTAYWVPPQPERIICLWVDESTLPYGAEFTPCHCDYGEVASDLYWTSTSDQVGEYIITFLIGEDCGYYVFPYPIKVIVYPPQEDNTPPVTTLLVGEPKYFKEETETWYVTSETPFTLSASDIGSGVEDIYYRTRYNDDWTNWTNYTGDFYLTGDGLHCIEFYAVDYEDNIEDTQSYYYYVDSFPPIFYTIKARGNRHHGDFAFICVGNCDMNSFAIQALYAYCILQTRGYPPSHIKLIMPDNCSDRNGNLIVNKRQIVQNLNSQTFQGTGNPCFPGTFNQIENVNNMVNELNNRVINETHYDRWRQTAHPEVNRWYNFFQIKFLKNIR